MTTSHSGTTLRKLLDDLPARVPVPQIDRVWVFPPRQLGGRETGLVVLALLPEDDQAVSRRLLTLRYEARGAGADATLSDTLAEQGTAPPESVQRVIDGVLHRLGDDAGEPALYRVGGESSRWQELLESLAPSPVDPKSGE